MRVDLHCRRPLVMRCDGLVARALLWSTPLLVLVGCASSPAPGARTSTPGQSQVSTPLAAGTAAVQTGAPAAPQPTSRPATAGMVPAVVGLPPERVGADTYRIGADDVLRIEVFQVDELSSTERVSGSGVVVMPLIGPVQLGGLTPPEAEARIAAALEKDFLQNPQVNIFVETNANQSFAVGGAVTNPGVFQLLGQTTLLEAIAQAGGVTRVANRSEVVLFREQPSGLIQAYVIDLKKVQAGELGDPTLLSNDKIMVPESGTAVFVRGVSETLRGFVSPF